MTTEQENNLIDDSAFASLSQGFGVIGQDRNADFVVNPSNVKQKTLELLFEVNNLAANIIEYLPESMGTKPIEFKSSDAENNYDKKVNKKLASITKYFIEATKIARLTGGSGILLGNSDIDLSKPREETSGINFYTIFEGGRYGILKIKSLDKNPLSPTYDQPLEYELRSTKTIIHQSRIIPFYGIKLLTKEQRRRNQYWGKPVLERSYEHLKNLSIADQSIAHTISQFSRLVYEIDNLTSLLGNEPGKKLLRERLNLINYSWNVLKTLLVAKGEKVSNLKTDFSGLSEMLSHFKEMLASSCDIPYQKLFNTSGSSNSLSGSSSASGSMDRSSERQWAEYVASKQHSDWLPGFERIVKSLVPSSKTYELEFPTILVLSESEVLANEKTKAEIDNMKKKPIEPKPTEPVEPPIITENTKNPSDNVDQTG